MNKLTKQIISLLLFVIGLIGFILQIFVFSSPDGTIDMEQNIMRELFR